MKSKKILPCKDIVASSNREKLDSLQGTCWSGLGQAGCSDHPGLRHTWKQFGPLSSSDQPLGPEPQAATSSQLWGWRKVTWWDSLARSTQCRVLRLSLTKSILFGSAKQNPQPWEVLQLPWKSAIPSSPWPDRTQLFSTCCPLCTDRWLSSDGSVKVLKPKPSCLLLQRTPLFPCRRPGFTAELWPLRFLYSFISAGTTASHCLWGCRWGHGVPPVHFVPVCHRGVNSTSQARHRKQTLHYAAAPSPSEGAASARAGAQAAPRGLTPRRARSKARSKARSRARSRARSKAGAKKTNTKHPRPGAGHGARGVGGGGEERIHDKAS